MSLVLTQTVYALAVNRSAYFNAVGGVGPVVYSVVAGGAGGTIDSSTGAYVAPSAIDEDPRKQIDSIKVVDSNLDEALAQIQVAAPLVLLCEIIQRELGLAAGRVYLWNQKITEPNDKGLYVVLSVPSCKPFGNVNRQVASGGGLDSEQFIAMSAVVDIDIKSRGTSALDRKEEVLMALNSNYSDQQQEANGFYVAKLSSRFINVSAIDGAAIPYWFRISVNVQYAVSKTKPVQYFDTFDSPETAIDS